MKTQIYAAPAVKGLRNVILPGTSQQTQHMYLTFVQRLPNVFDIGPTLHKCYTNVLCLLERLIY